MSRPYQSHLEYSSSDKDATQSDLVNAARRRFAKLVEAETTKVVAEGGEPWQALKKIHEITVARSVQIAKAHGYEGDLETRVRDLLRQKNPIRGFSKDLFGVEAIAKAVGVWDKNNIEDLTDPYQYWEKIFSVASDIAIFSHAHPLFWTADRIRAQVSARARMLIMGHPISIRRLLVLPDDSAKSELGDPNLQALIKASMGVPSKELVGKAFNSEKDRKRFDDFPIQTKWAKKGSLAETWREFLLSRKRTYKDPPISGILWRENSTSPMKAMIWELSEDRSPFVIRSITNQSHIDDLVTYFDYVFADVDGEMALLTPGKPKEYSKKELQFAAKHSVP